MLIEIPAQSGDSIEAVARQLSYVALKSGRPDHYISCFALAVVRTASHKLPTSEFLGIAPEDSPVPIKYRGANGD